MVLDESRARASGAGERGQGINREAVALVGAITNTVARHNGEHIHTTGACCRSTAQLPRACQGHTRGQGAIGGEGGGGVTAGDEVEAAGLAGFDGVAGRTSDARCLIHQQLEGLVGGSGGVGGADG